MTKIWTFWISQQSRQILYVQPWRKVFPDSLAPDLGAPSKTRLKLNCGQWQFGKILHRHSHCQTLTKLHSLHCYTTLHLPLHPQLHPQLHMELHLQQYLHLAQLLPAWLVLLQQLLQLLQLSSQALILAKKQNEARNGRRRIGTGDDET